MHQKTRKITNEKTINNKAVVGIIIVALFISLILFVRVFGAKDITKDYIKYSAPWLFVCEIFLFILLNVLFLYIGFKYFTNNNKHLLVIVISVLSIVTLINILSFNPALNMNDDNSRYLCGAISIAETGQYKSIQHPEEKFITLDQPGMSIMLAPFVKVLGVKIVLYTILILLMSIGSVVLLYYMLKKIFGWQIAIIIALLFGTNSFFTDFSSIIMAEMPFVFFYLLSIIFLQIYDQKEKINYIFLVLSSLSILMTFFFRSVGIALSISSVLYFFLKKDWKKGILLGVILFFLIGSWQFRCAMVNPGNTQISAFTGGNGFGGAGIIFMVKKGFKNLIIILNLIPQVLFPQDISRRIVHSFSVLGFMVISIIGTGLVVNMIKKRSLYDFFFIVSILVLAIGTPDSNNIPMARYLCVYIPFYLIYFFIGLNFLLSLINKNNVNMKALILLPLLLILFSNYSGTALHIQSAHLGQTYTESVSSYIEAGKWMKDNTPKDAIVACRKENTFYLFSQRKGYQFASHWSKYSQEYEEFRLKQFEKYNVSYVIIDTFSNSWETAAIIVRNNPDKFSLFAVVGNDKDTACYIFKVIKWWQNYPAQLN